jgi:hypothetical protein
MKPKKKSAQYRGTINLAVSIKKALELRMDGYVITERTSQKPDRPKACRVVSLTGDV